MTINIMKNLLILIVFLGVAACQSPAPDEAAPEAATAEAAVLELTAEQMALAGIELGRPEKRSLSGYIDCTGMVEVPPESLFSVYSPVNGFVGHVNLLPGDYVRKGTLLTTIRHPELVRLQREFLEVKSQLGFLQQDYRRKDTLASAEAASQKSLEQARADLDLAKARYQGLKAELDLIGINTGTLEEKGEIQSEISLYAPHYGYLTEVNINRGKLIGPEDLLFEIVDNNHLHLELQVFAKDLERLEKGQRIECNLPGSDKTYAADVYLIGRMIDAERKTARVHGHFEMEPVPLTPGTYVQARIHTDEREVMTLPEGAVVREGGQAFVYRKKNGGFERVPVQVGKADNGYVEIIDLQLAEGELVAVKGAYYIKGSEGGEE